MSLLSTALHERPVLKGALLVPSVIALVFSLFNLSAVPDPARVAAATVIATVNADEGLAFPPINVAGQMLNGLAQRLPVTLQAYPDADAARAALNAEEVAAVLVFPPEFSRSVTGQGAVPLTLLTSGSLPAASGQMVAALPAMVETGVTAAVQSIRMALAQGRMPDFTPPVALAAEVVNPPANPAARMAPFVANFVTALMALVGAIIGWVGTRGLAPGRAAALQVVLPVVAVPVAAAVLVAVVVGFAGGGPVMLWLAVAGLGIALGWAFAGALALTGPLALLALVPLVFWQGVLGGAQVPVAAAPDWLAWLEPLGMAGIGGMFRSLILGGPHGFPWLLALVAALAGLAMLGFKAMVGRA